MSGHDETLTNAKLRWGIWILTLGHIDIEDLMQTMQTMLIPHDMDPFWLEGDSSGPQDPTITGSGQENLVTSNSATNSNGQKGLGTDESVIVTVGTGNTGEKLKDEVETQRQDSGDKTGSGIGRIEIVKEEK